MKLNHLKKCTCYSILRKEGYCYSALLPSSFLHFLLFFFFFLERHVPETASVLGSVLFWSTGLWLLTEGRKERTHQSPFTDHPAGNIWTIHRLCPHYLSAWWDPPPHPTPAMLFEVNLWRPDMKNLLGLQDFRQWKMRNTPSNGCPLQLPILPSFQHLLLKRPLLWHPINSLFLIHQTTATYCHECIFFVSLHLLPGTTLLSSHPRWVNGRLLLPLRRQMGWIGPLPHWSDSSLHRTEPQWRKMGLAPFMLGEGKIGPPKKMVQLWKCKYFTTECTEMDSSSIQYWSVMALILLLSLVYYGEAEKRN